MKRCAAGLLLIVAIAVVAQLCGAAWHCGYRAGYADRNQSLPPAVRPR